MKRSSLAAYLAPALLLLAPASGCRCSRTTRVTPRFVPSLDAALAAPPRAPDAALALDAAPLPEFGPANPWEGPLPTSTASGPEAATTRARLAALRAIIGFWRIDQHDRARCPTLGALAADRRSGFRAETDGADAWGHPVEIQCQGAQVRLRSLGPDGLPDTPDDLWSR